MITLILIIFFLTFTFLYFFIYFTNEGFEVKSKIDIDVPNQPPQLMDAKSVRQLYRLNRIYPLNGASYYDVGAYPNVVLPGEVVGCGSRREPCYGGSQQVVSNLLPPLNISNNNIAPTNGKIGPSPPFMQVGYLYKIFAPYSDNAYLPLYLNKVNEKNGYYNYKYFTIDNDEKRNVITPSKHRQLGTNDQVTIEGEKYFYRVSINESDFPTYPRISGKVI